MVTQVQQRQVADGAINNAKVQAGAAIATSKLADGASFVNKDGSITMTGALNMGSQLINAVATPSAGTDAANKNYVDTLISGLNSLFDSKGSARAATTANITLSGAQTIDGISIVAGEIVLVKSQTAPAENGLYVAASGAWTRTTDMDAWAEVPGAFVAVEEGSTLADTIWLCTSNAGGTLNTTAIVWFQIPTTGFTNSNFVDKEIPTGSINGSNVTFTLANTPIAGSEHGYLNGLLQTSGSGNDYTISGAVVTYLSAPLTGERLIFSYRK